MLPLIVILAMPFLIKKAYAATGLVHERGKSDYIGDDDGLGAAGAGMNAPMMQRAKRAALLKQHKRGNPMARARIAAIKARARAGDPKARAEAARLKATANDLDDSDDDSDYDDGDEG